MTTFYQGPPLLLNVLILAVIGAILLPFLYQATDSFLISILVFIGIAMVYGVTIFTRGVTKTKRGIELAQDDKKTSTDS